LTPFLSEPVGLNGTADGTNVDLVWGAIVEDTPIEHYAVMWTYGDYPGWGISVVNQNVTIANLPEDTDVTFRVRSDNDTLGIYSAYSDPITIRTGVDPVIEPPVIVDPPVEPPVVDPPVVPPVEPPVELTPPVVEPPGWFHRTACSYS